MSSTKIGRRTGVSAAVSAAARRDDELIAHAAKRTSWAGSVLESAARDLASAHGDDGNALTGIAEVVLEEATRVSHLASDIESHRPIPDGAKLPRGLGR
jgi:hypothetical protein